MGLVIRTDRGLYAALGQSSWDRMDDGCAILSPHLTRLNCLGQAAVPNVSQTGTFPPTRARTSYKSGKVNNKSKATYYQNRKLTIINTPIFRKQRKNATIETRREIAGMIIASRAHAPAAQKCPKWSEERLRLSDHLRHLSQFCNWGQSKNIWQGN